MTIAAIKLTWSNRNHYSSIDGTNIYRSTSPIDPENLPTVYDFVAGNSESYVDYGITADTLYYYRTAAVVGSEIKVGPEHMVPSSSEYKHDIFNDGSAIATYTFNGNTNDLGSRYSFTGGTFVRNGGSLDLNGVAYDLGINGTTLGQSFTVSFWTYYPTNVAADLRIIDFDNGSGNGTMVITDGQYVDFIYQGISVARVDVSSYIGVSEFHVVATSEGKLFVNGLEATSSSGNTKSTSQSTVHIGGYDATTQAYNGTINQLRIFNQPITADKVALLYSEVIL